MIKRRGYLSCETAMKMGPVATTTGATGLAKRRRYRSCKRRRYRSCKMVTPVVSATGTRPIFKLRSPAPSFKVRYTIRVVEGNPQTPLTQIR
jgi:hypothetical protein